MRLSLKPHPDFPNRAITAITVHVFRSHASTLDLHYVAEGDVSRVIIPPPAESQRRDELWRQTCFEAFLRGPAGARYAEFNFSPSTEHAAYTFTGYREGMRGAYCAQPQVSSTSSPDRLELRAEIWMGRLGLNFESSLRLGLSAIIEETDGTKSYWALAHPQGKPDFHHADSFVLDLPLPERT